MFRMSYCLNPSCRKPQNPDDAKFCLSCGTKLLLGDRYRAISPLGAGGFGRTLRAIDEHRPSKPDCAIKQFIPLDLGVRQAAKALELFHQEAERLDQLGQHPQIPTLLAHFSQEQRQYLVQEFIAGATLAQELSTQGQFSEVQVRQILLDLLPVLEFIHQQHVIHRDIKPENIIRRQGDQQLVLVDFGAAKFATETLLSRTGTVISSAGYTAPEQLLGKAVFASDLFSLASTCIHLLTERPPSDLFDTAEDSWQWHQFLPVPISDVLRRILDQMLARATRRRYASAKAVLQDLLPVVPAAPTILPSTTRGRAQPDPTIGPEAAPPRWRCVRTLAGHSQAMVGVAIVSELSGETLVSISEDGTIKLWDLNSWMLAGILGAHTGRVNAIAVAGDGPTLICGGETGNLGLWNLATGEWVETLNAHQRSIRAIATSMDHKLLITGGNDRTIKCWHLAKRELLSNLAAETTVYSLALSADQQFLVSGGYDGIIRIWQTATGKLLQRLHWQLGPIQALSIRPGEPLLAAGGQDGTIRLWQLPNRHPIQTLTKHAQPIRCLCFSPNGQFLATGSEDGVIKLWNLETGQLQQSLKEHTGIISSLCFSADGQILASASHDQTVKLWRSHSPVPTAKNG